MMPNCSRICSMTLAVFALRSTWNMSVSGTLSGQPATTQLAVSAAEMSLRYWAATRNLYTPVCARALLSYTAVRPRRCWGIAVSCGILRASRLASTCPQSLTIFAAIAAGGVTSVMKASLNFPLASGARNMSSHSTVCLPSPSALKEGSSATSALRSATRSVACGVLAITELGEDVLLSFSSARALLGVFLDAEVGVFAALSCSALDLASASA